MGYNGSKGGNGTWQQIISRLPACDIFIEAMSGSGILSQRLNHLVAHTVTNDYDAGIQATHNLHYSAVIDKYDCNGHGKAVFYFDPPYILETRRSNKKLYKHDWSITDHEKFLSRVLTVKSDCMISHYPHKLYSQLLQSWRTVSFQSMTHKGLATEVLWMNYPPPTLLLAGHTVGNDCWRRQGLKRKTNRLLNKIIALPPDERAAIVSAIKKEFL